MQIHGNKSKISRLRAALTISAVVFAFGLTVSLVMAPKTYAACTDPDPIHCIFNPSPTPTKSPKPTTTPSPSPSASASPSPSPSTIIPLPVVTPTPTPSPTPSDNPSPTATPDLVSAVVDTPTPTPTPEVLGVSTIAPVPVIDPLVSLVQTFARGSQYGAVGLTASATKQLVGLGGIFIVFGIALVTWPVLVKSKVKPSRKLAK